MRYLIRLQWSEEALVQGYVTIKADSEEEAREMAMVAWENGECNEEKNTVDKTTPLVTIVDVRDWWEPPKVQDIGGKIRDL